MHPYSTTRLGPKPIPLRERLYRSIDRSGGPDTCWPWMLSRDRGGYGRIAIGRRMTRAHVVMYRLTFGDPPPDKPRVLHTCDNPPCCNPRHLWAGTITDNNRDTVLKGRHVETKKTHCPQGHPYDEVNTYIRSSGRRLCKTCQHDQSVRRWQQTLRDRIALKGCGPVGACAVSMEGR